MYTRKFQDEKGRTKFVQRKEGIRDLFHSGNRNYILANDEVVFHPCESIVKKYSHVCGINKMM